MYFPASYMEDYAVLHDVNPHLAFYAVGLSRPLSIVQVYLVLTLL